MHKYCYIILSAAININFICITKSCAVKDWLQFLQFYRCLRIEIHAAT